MAIQLFWSEHGQVTCERHAPMRGSDSWKWERWRKMTPAEQEDWGCEVCASLAIRAERDRADDDHMVIADDDS